MKKRFLNNNQYECELLVNYLLSNKATPGLCIAYELALEKIPIGFSDEEKKLWQACLHYSWLLPYVDAYLAFRSPSHPIRKKLFLMLALLETQPDYHQYFLPARSTYLQLPVVLLKAFHSLLKIGIGRILIWIIL